TAIENATTQEEKWTILRSYANNIPMHHDDFEYVIENVIVNEVENTLELRIRINDRKSASMWGNATLKVTGF
ncbi:MAG: hypothetical protein ACRC63_01260, partial [Metamycoplasmataceae bacterium]